MKIKKLIVKTKTDSYPIIIGSNLLGNLSKILKKNSLNCNQFLLVIDKNVPKKFILKIDKSLKDKKIRKFLFNSSEKSKNLKTVNKILDVLLKKNFSRQDCLVSIGGGITGDVGGFAASLFKRGLKFINIPTTLLSQVDSSVGGKTGVNSKYGKNLIGSFYQPNLVISDVNFLNTLPRREIVCGYAEILKHSIIMKKSFYNFLNKNISKILKLKSPFVEKAIYESCKIKKSVIEKDEKEKGDRKVLNFGHTFAHAFEASLGYSKKLNHGEAVILGMNTALNFSFSKKYINKDDYNLIINHLNQNNLPCKIKNYFSVKDLNKILFFMTKDKKNYSNKINLILIKKIGSTIINKNFDYNVLKRFLINQLTN